MSITCVPMCVFFVVLATGDGSASALPGANVVQETAQKQSLPGEPVDQDQPPAPAVDEARDVAAQLTPPPHQITRSDGRFVVTGGKWTVYLPSGGPHDGCRRVLGRALEQAGGTLEPATLAGDQFAVGEPSELPALPGEGDTDEAYVLRITPRGISARGASPTGLLYAAQTLRQLLRCRDDHGSIPCLTIVDYPRFRTRGIYIEGGQERFGRIVAKEYLIEQIRRLCEFKMNTLLIECYNLFPYPSFPACADQGTLSEEDCQEIVAESKRWHVTIIPSLQTLAQAHELVWACPEGVPYRETTAPGLMCPSNPAIYPLIEGFYRDLLRRFDDAPVIGIGCSEIDMQWTGRYCPACQARVDAGQTVRELLLGHAEQCIAAVHRVAAELGRPVRPLMWGDEFYMYGPGKDWVGIDRIPHDTVMGYWKYWEDYAGIDGLLERGYDVLGISAMYNHTFYLADLSPERPKKLWAPMEQTGTRNITAMLDRASRARGAARDGRFWGAATASFSKHRLRAFDSIWYGFALNGHAAWGDPQAALAAYQDAFTAAFSRHYYDARTDSAAHALAAAYVRLDDCKSQLELANQTLRDVVGIVDTQEPGYAGNTLLGAVERCGHLLRVGGEDAARVLAIQQEARRIEQEAADIQSELDSVRSDVAGQREWEDLRLAAEKIAVHAERQVLMIDTQSFLLSAAERPADDWPDRAAALAERWAAHRSRTADVLAHARDLYSRGDPLGLERVLADIATLEGHLRHGAERQDRTAAGAIDAPLEERFEHEQPLDAARWIILGSPTVRNGVLETRAPGGWDHYCGIATRNTWQLDPVSPTVIEYEVTTLETGVDSQLLASADDRGLVSYQFSLCNAGGHFVVYTQSASPLTGPWENCETGWKLRARSAPVERDVTYRVRAELTRTTWRVTVARRDALPLQPPCWDSGPVPMDDLAEMRLVFADVEPEHGTASTCWGPIRIVGRRSR